MSPFGSMPGGEFNLLPQVRTVFRVKSACLAAIVGFIWVLRLYVSPSTLAWEISQVVAIAMIPALLIALRREDPSKPWVFFALLCDLVALTIAIHFGGGADQTSGPILYGVVILLGGLLVSEQAGVALTGAAIVLYCAMIAAEYFDWVPHHVAYRRPPDRQAATALMVSVYLAVHGWLVAYVVNLIAKSQKFAQEARGEAVRTLSHDLKNALFAISGYAQMIAEEGDAASAERARRVAFIAAETEDLLSNMIDATSADVRPLVVRAEVFSPARLVDRVKNWYEGTAADIGVTIATDISGAPASCFADERLLQRALNNLVGNALRHVGRGGKIEIGCRQDGLVVTWWVEDNGDGIRPELIAHIFEPFFSGELPQAMDKRSGLGLFVVQRVAQAHGGEATVHSVLGRGSRFSITFPARLPPPAAT
ncbi:MAG: HAMP domain-containing histidine kinase [Candidatus Binatia bacterium]|nr:HAMP domain-containing histidine kinase [Candidatus Binatia bacterium]